MTIDGTTEPDYEGIPVIEINGTVVSASEDGPWHGLRITGNDSVVRGLAINNFALVGAGVGIEIVGGDGNSVQANAIGTDPSGTVARPNGAGIEISGGATDNEIGGSAEERNVISGNDRQGVAIFGTGTSLNLVDSNYIGLDATGSIDLGNGSYGVQINDAGTNTVSSNLITGNDGGGVVLGGIGVTTANQLIEDNGIGVDEAGSVLGQGGAGVSITDSSGHQVHSNTIAGHTDAGILVFGDTSTGNELRFNEITQNDGLGIDLDPEPRGVTPNDVGDGDGGENGLQNFPVLTSATAGSGETTIHGRARAARPTTTFELDFFASAMCDPSDHGEGGRTSTRQTILTGPGATGDSSTPSGPSSRRARTSPRPRQVRTGRPSSPPAAPYSKGPQNIYVVNSNADDPGSTPGCDPADCTLREAIVAANERPRADTIEFDSRPAATMIDLASALPAITATVTIDGQSSQGPRDAVFTQRWTCWAPGTDFVLAPGSGGSFVEELDSTTSRPAPAIRIQSHNNTIQGLALGTDLGHGVAADVFGSPSWAATRSAARSRGAQRDLGCLVRGDHAGLRRPRQHRRRQLRSVRGGEDQAPGRGLRHPGARILRAHVIGYGVGPAAAARLPAARTTSRTSWSGGAGTRSRHGIAITSGSSGTILAGNIVGTDRTRTRTDLGNFGPALRPRGRTTDQLEPGNVIAYNGMGGLSMDASSGNRIVANSIHHNTGPGL